MGYAYPCGILELFIAIVQLYCDARLWKQEYADDIESRGGTHHIELNPLFQPGKTMTKYNTYRGEHLYRK